MLNFFLKQKIRNAKVISFDIFDTLLVRPFLEPCNVFSYLGEVLQEKDFFAYRFNAENVLRQHGNAYPTYDAIYEIMPKKFQYIKEKERNLELDTLFANPKIKKIYDYALKLKKKIIIVSDMYFDEETLKKALNKNGYYGFDKIYISAYQKKSKWDTSLFTHIIDELKIDPQKIFHIGDNKVADYSSAKQVGIQAFRIKAPRDIFRKENKRLRPFIDKHKNTLTGGIIIGNAVKQMVLGKKSPNYWDEFGYSWGGPFAYALSSFVVDQMRKDNRNELICVARDGYTIEKIVNILAQEIKTHYIYAGRCINILTSMDYSSDYSWCHKPASLIRLTRELSDEFAQKSKDTDLNSASACTAVIEKNIDLIEPIANEVFSKYLDYLKNFDIREERLALFDITGGSYNSYKLLKRSLPNKDILGLYWYALDNPEINCCKYSDHTQYTVSNYELLEFLITAPELPVKNLHPEDGFVRIDNKYEKQRIKCYQNISEAEIQWSKDYLDSFKETVIFDPVILVEYMNVFCNKPSRKDVKHLSTVFHGKDEAHTIYERLFPKRKNIFQKMFYTKKHNGHKIFSILGIKIKFKIRKRK